MFILHPNLQPYTYVDCSQELLAFSKHRKEQPTGKSWYCGWLRNARSLRTTLQKPWFLMIPLRKCQQTCGFNGFKVDFVMDFVQPQPGSRRLLGVVAEREPGAAPTKSLPEMFFTWWVGKKRPVKAASNGCGSTMGIHFGTLVYGTKD